MTITDIPAVAAHIEDDTPNGALLRASWSAPLAEVRGALARGADLGAATQAGQTALIFAAFSNEDWSVAHHLIELGLSLTACDALQRSPLHGFAGQGADQLVQLALAAGMPVNAPSSDGTPLKLAAAAGYTSTVRLLLGAGADCAAADDGMTALHVATGTAIIDALVAAGAPLEARNATGATPLIACALTGTDEECARLLALGARPDAHDTTGWTALHWAAGGDTVNVLLGAGADIEAVNKEGVTALLSNLVVGSVTNDASRALIRAAANVHAAWPNGKSALVCAAEKSNIDIFLLLLEFGAQPTAALDPLLAKDPDLQHAFDAWRARQAMQTVLHPARASSTADTKGGA